MFDGAHTYAIRRERRAWFDRAGHAMHHTLPKVVDRIGACDDEWEALVRFASLLIVRTSDNDAAHRWAGANAGSGKASMEWRGQDSNGAWHEDDGRNNSRRTWRLTMTYGRQRPTTFYATREES